MSAAAPDRVAVPGGVLPPPPPCPRPAPFLRSAICSGRRDYPQASVQQDCACTRRRGTVARARTRGPGSARSHKGGGTRGRRRPGRLSQGARVAQRTARRPCPPDSSAAAARPVQLRPAPGYEVDARLSVTTSLQYVHAARTRVPRPPRGSYELPTLPEGPRSREVSSPLSLPPRELGPRVLRPSHT